jgi:hypothetical protein
MKNIKLFLLAAVPAAMLTACGSVGGLFTPSTVQRQVVTTNLVPWTQIIYQTNMVTVTQTNGVTQTNQVVVTTTNTVTVPTMVTNTVTVTNGWTVSSAAQGTLTAVGTVNQATAAVDPYSGLLTAFLGLAAGGLGWLAKIKTNQAATASSVSQTVITAVEGLAPTVAPAVKAAVTAQSAKMGTGAAVASVVQAVTQNLA